MGGQVDVRSGIVGGYISIGKQIGVKLRNMTNLNNINLKIDSEFVISLHSLVLSRPILTVQHEHKHAYTPQKGKIHHL